MFDKNRIIVLAPHTDDGELGCGAAIVKYLQGGKEIIYVAFSTCSQSLPKHLASDTLSVECKEATKTLGIAAGKVLMFDFEVRQLLFRRQEVLDQLIRLNETYKPELVFLPAQYDVHQDHQVVYAEGLRAFKNASVLGYELPWNNTRFQPNYFESVSEANLQHKITALKEYKSQHHRSYMQEDFIRSLACVRGIQANTKYAEAFEVYRLMA